MSTNKKGVLQACLGRFSKLWTPPPKKKNVEQIYSKRSAVYSEEKQKQLQALCESLFTKKELISTGRLQLIGLNKVKKKLGKMWPGLQSIVYQEVEESISKYMMPNDIFIRYKDDSYVVVFAEAGIEEALIKARLIAEEIRRRLFEHEEQELKNINVEESVTTFTAEDFKNSKDFTKKLDNGFNSSKKKSLNKPQPNKDYIPSPVEVDPYESNNKKEVTPQENESRYKPVYFSYVPYWDVKNNLLTTYLCVSSFTENNEEPFDEHENVFMGTAPSEKTRLDLLMLDNVINELDMMAKDGRKLYIACPVHYDTLTRSYSFQKYILKCQTIPKEHKCYLTFVILGLTTETYSENIPKFSKTLRKHCHAMHAQIPLDTNYKFSLFRENHFDAVGVRIKSIKGSEKDLLKRLNVFTSLAKKSLIKNTFILDVSSLSVTTSVVCDGYDFLSGSLIHESVQTPDNIYRFKHENLFSNISN